MEQQPCQNAAAGITPPPPTAAADWSPPPETPPVEFDDEDVYVSEDEMSYGEDGSELEAAAMEDEEMNGSAANDSVEVWEHADGAIQLASPEMLHSNEEPSIGEEDAENGGLSAVDFSNGYAASYHLPSESEGDFYVADLVWGKVRSHPWWPGQIFHPSDASGKAEKYYRKDCYLVAYFGDHTFAWNEASLLKPFGEHFAEAVRQSNAESFRNAVNCALKEVSRRVEFGLACSCVPEEALDKIKFQTVENSGIRQASSVTGNIDMSSGAESFDPGKFIEYIKALAKSPSSGYDRLDVTISKAQLLAFSRLKGYYSLPTLQVHGETSENAAETSGSEGEQLVAGVAPADSVPVDRDKLTSSGKGREASRKRKHNLKDIVYRRRKQKSWSELMGESVFCLDSDYESDEKDVASYAPEPSGEKSRAGADLVDDPGVRSATPVSLAEVSAMVTTKPRQSFKIGECIRRVASQLSGAPIVLKYNDESHKQFAQSDSDESLKSLEDSPNGHADRSQENSSVERLLGKLHLTAQHPMKGYSFSNTIIGFFSEFRNSVVPTPSPMEETSAMGKVSVGRKRKSSLSIIESPQTFEFDDVNDPYWKDMVVEHNSAENVVRRGRKRKECNPVTSDLEKPLHPKPRRRSKKQPTPVPDAEKEVEDNKKPVQLPTELILNFTRVESVPSEENLVRIFRYFGPLTESETIVDRETGCARVVFKRGSDAQVAYSSAAVFNIFGSVVNYKLDYESSTSSKSSLLALTQGLDDAAA
ncbi:PWWP domain-containing protein [Drosera capensis]